MQFQAILLDRGLDYEVVELSDSARIAEEAALALGVATGQIVKSLIFQDADTQAPVLMLVSGANRVDQARVESSIERRLKKADAKVVKRHTGFSIGGVPPIEHKHDLPVFIDRDLPQYETTWAAAGSPHAVFCIEGPITGLAAQGELIDVK